MAKTELEDAGLETEGMVESTAKLRDLIKGISGVDIMLDENTFKSTYQIIEEIGRVWKDISDVNQASLLEAIAGKRQSNIVAAALNNYERLDQVLEKSINSENSARKEQEEYAKSIQYSIDTLKAAYQGFAQTVIKSDFVKALLGTAQNLLEVLTKIVDKVGMLPPLLSAVGVGLSRKGISVFDTVKTDAEGANRQITIFGKTFSQIRSDVNSADAKGLKKVEAGIKSVGLQAKATQLAVLAMNTAISVGISLAISGAISLVSKWINKEKEAAEQAEKLRQEMEERRNATIENIKAYEEESKSVQDLVGRYIQLVSSTDNLTEIKDGLLSVQDQIINKYGLEADAIDLVNGKLEDNIALLLEQDKKRNESWLRENKDAINEAEDLFSYSENIYRAAGSPSSVFGFDYENFGWSDDEFQDFITKFKQEINQSGLDKYLEDWAGETGSDVALRFKEGLKPDEYNEAINELVSIYEKLKNESPEIDFGNIEALYDNLLNIKNVINQSYSIISEANKTQTQSLQLENILNSEDLKTYEDTIKKLTELKKIREDTTNVPSQRYGASLELHEQEDVIRALIEKYPVLADRAEAALKNIKMSLSGVEVSEEELYANFKEQLDKTHKEALDNINKIESAMASAIKGEGLEHGSAWDILNLDKDNLLGTPLIDSSGKYHMQLENLISLKDKLIEENKILIQQDLDAARSGKAKTDNDIALAQLELANVTKQIREQARGNSKPSQELIKTQYELGKSIESLEKSSKAWGNEIQRDTTLIREYDRHLGNLANTQTMIQAQIDALKKSQEKMKTDLESLNKSADNLLKAQETKIDQIVDKLEDEKKVLEDNKEILEEQLETLEKQQKQLEEIIENYETVADVVGSTIDKQIDELKKNQSDMEEYYDNLIDKLKEENSERKDALDYAEKLTALENAKKNKVRVYGAATGWTYQEDKDAVTKAQKALEEADSDKAIKELENEKKERVKSFEEQIKAFEEYAKQWTNIKTMLEDEENERLANQLLGLNWREKIEKKDVQILNRFKSEYKNYNSQLNNLVNGEIAALKKSIEVRDNEIKAKQKIIDSWNDYKKTAQNAANQIKNANEDYMKMLDQITLNEASDLKTRDNNLNGFKNHYLAYMNAIVSKNNELEQTTDRITELTNELQNLSDVGVPDLQEWTDAINEMTDSVLNLTTAALLSVGDIFGADSYKGQAARLVRQMKGYSEGGEIDYTGLAKVHGTPSHSEVAFSASQARELYSMVKTGEFSTQIENRVIQGLGTALKKLSSGNTSTSNAVSIGTMVIKADNPKQFHDQFTREINSYMSLQLNNSYIK